MQRYDEVPLTLVNFLLHASRCLVVVSFDGFVDILGIQTDSQLAICFPGIGE